MGWLTRLRAALRDDASTAVVELVRTGSAAEAQVIVALLREHGVDAAAEDLGLDMRLTGRPRGGRVLVNRPDAGRARDVLARAEHDRRRPPS